MLDEDTARGVFPGVIEGDEDRAKPFDPAVAEAERIDLPAGVPLDAAGAGAALARPGRVSANEFALGMPDLVVCGAFRPPEDDETIDSGRWEQECCWRLGGARANAMAQSCSTQV